MALTPTRFFSITGYGILAGMKPPLLQTKFYIPPPRPDLVPRPRLIERLNDSLQGKLTLISAPAGFGKTTLVSNWIYDLRFTIYDLPSDVPDKDKILNPKIVNRVAWLSLDEADNDPTRFLTSFIAVLQQIDPEIGQMAQNLLQSPQPPPLEALMTTLINNLTTVSTEFVLVLDDYHLIEAKPIHDALTFLLDHWPPQLHLLITTRADPPLPLARLRGRGQLIEVRAADLRFTTEEAATLLTELRGLELSAEAIKTLTTRTEGWITGLHLAALSLRGHSDPAGFINGFTGSHRYILDYLADEVLNRQTEEMKAFLLQTSILTRLSGPLCDVVTQRSHSQALLESLDAANLFIVPLDDERRWYRYHHLFADVLRSRLHETMGAHDVVSLHHRASEWYEQNAPAPDSHEFMAEAINHALVGEDFERVARLIAQTADTAIWQRGEINTVLSWLDRLPHQAERAWPQLSLTHALLLAWLQQFDAAESLLEGVIASTQTLSTIERDKFLGQAATIRATMANMQGDAQQAMGFAQKALEYLPEDDVQSRGLSLGILGSIYRARGEVSAGIQAYTEASARLQTGGQRVPALIALAYLGQLQMLGGQLNRANATYQQALQLAEAWGVQKLPAAGVVVVSLGDLWCEWNDLATAERHLQEGIGLCRQWEGLGDDLADGYLGLARVSQAQGDLAGALSLLAQAQQLARAHHMPQWAVPVAAYQARLWLAQRNLAAVEQWVQERGLRVDDSPSGYPREIEVMTLARLLIAQGKADRAIVLLTRWLPAAEAAGRVGRVIEMLVVQALAEQAQGRIAQAVATLAQALTLAESAGYVRLFVDEGQPMAVILRHAASQGLAPKYVSQLLAVFGSTFGDSASPPSQPLIDPLTERELEVLRLVAAGLSNQALAQALVITVGTVRRHLNSLYGKLNVHSRTEAVARARDLGLL